VGAGQVTAAVPDGSVVDPVAPDGTDTVGGVVSTTCTGSLAAFAALSLQLIVESPTGKCDVAVKSVSGPPVGVQVTIRPRCDFTW
jgi:hypothetical protein